MEKFYTDERVREPIAALESHSPGIWATMKRLALTTAPPDEGYETTLTSTTRVFSIVYPHLPFIVRATDKLVAMHGLNVELGNTLRAGIASDTSATNP